MGAFDDEDLTGRTGGRRTSRPRSAPLAAALLVFLTLFCLFAAVAPAGAVTAPGRPTAKTPKGAINTTRPTFKWSKAARAAKYEVRVYKGRTLKLKKTGITRLSWKSSKTLPRGVSLTWKVRGRNAGGNGAWSKRLTFKVRAATKAITAFSFASPAATGVIDETFHTIAVTVPFGTDVTALTPTITFTGASVSLASGLTTDFTSPVVYTVTAADSSTQAYVVTVTVAPPPSFPKAITAFAFSSPAASGVVNETLHTIAVTVPFGTDVTALAPTIAITGASVSPLSAAPQNFTSPVTYTVTAADASTQPYVVTVTVAGPAIGQSYGGGIIAYVLQPEDTGYVAGETHGLIAATVDLRGGDTLPWTNYAFAAEGVPGGTGTAIGTGADNTTWIIYQAYPGGNTFYAAYEARAYRGGGYDDWYLPSKDELSKLYDCWALGFGGFQSLSYWSSSEWEEWVVLARCQFFGDGAQGAILKSQLNAVRPVRSF